MNRREVFRGIGRGFMASVAAKLPLRAAPNGGGGIYGRIGMKPVINCKGTFTIISGSQSLPEVKQDMDEASRHYVHLDELMDGVGRRLAELTRAEWGIVTAGCAAALTHATAACVAGSNPEKMQRLPNLEGLKHEVVMPRQSRNVYDHAIRMVGVKMVTPESRPPGCYTFRKQYPFSCRKCTGSNPISDRNIAVKHNRLPGVSCLLHCNTTGAANGPTKNIRCR